MSKLCSSSTSLFTYFHFNVFIEAASFYMNEMISYTLLSLLPPVFVINTQMEAHTYVYTLPCAVQYLDYIVYSIYVVLEVHWSWNFGWCEWYLNNLLFIVIFLVQYTCLSRVHCGTFPISVSDLQAVRIHVTLSLYTDNQIYSNLLYLLCNWHHGLLQNCTFTARQVKLGCKNTWLIGVLHI